MSEPDTGLEGAAGEGLCWMCLGLEGTQGKLWSLEAWSFSVRVIHTE